MSDRPSLARALCDAVRALPARERAVFDRLIGGEGAAPARAARAPHPTGEALTRDALDELRGGGGHRAASLSDLLGDT